MHFTYLTDLQVLPYLPSSGFPTPRHKVMDVSMSLTLAAAEVCTMDADCGYLQVCSANVCAHKDLWPLSVFEVLAAVFVFVVSAMANAAGITGCSMMIPVLIIVGGFTTHQTIPIVQLVAFAGVFMAIIYRFNLRHPCRDRPRIDFSLAMHICMPLLLGTCYGVIVNAIMPDWIILILLTLTLGFGAYGTFNK